MNMKLRTKIISIIFSLLFIFAFGMFFGHVSIASANASGSVQDYLVEEGITSFSANSANGISITLEGASQNNLVSFVSISVTDWTNISNLQIKRMVLNTIQNISKDDTNTAITSSSSEFLFHQNGIYIVEYDLTINPGTLQETIERKAVYSSFDFEKEFNLNAITITNGTLYANQNFNGEIANIITKTGSENIALSISSAKINSELYSYEFSAGSDSITTNSTKSLTLKSVLTNSTIAKIDFEVFCVFPTFVHKNINNEIVSDVFSGTETPDGTNGKLYFNEDVLVSLDFADLDEEYLTKRFAFSTEENENTITSTYSISSSTLSSQNKIIKSETIEICKNPSNNIEFRIGFNTSTAPIYPNLSTSEPIYAFTDLYAHAKNSSVTLTTSSVGDRLIVYGKINSNVVFAYNFEYAQYNAATATLEVDTTSQQGKIIITKPSIPVPVDLTIINQENERFVSKNIFLGISAESTTIEITETGTYQVIIAYANVTEADLHDEFFHRSFQYNVYGKSISMTVNNTPIFDGQITNGPVVVKATETTSHTATQISFSVIHNTKNLGEFSSAKLFSDEGHYIVSNGVQTYEFAIISTDSKIAYSANSTENAILLSYTNNGQTTEVDKSTDLKKSGSYKLNYNLYCGLSLDINNNQEIIEYEKPFSFVVNISVPYFNVVANVENGKKSADPIVINSIQANGNYTIKITHNKKTTTYSSSEFSKLSEKQRTFSSSGIYQLLITDEAGNEYSFTFEKYYKANAILIILIILLTIGIGISLYLIIRLRLRAKVK